MAYDGACSDPGVATDMDPVADHRSRPDVHGITNYDPATNTRLPVDPAAAANPASRPYLGAGLHIRG